MDYYIQGDAARAKEIKVAFEAKGCTLYRLASNCDSEDLIYYSLNGIVRGIKKDNLYLFEAHPGYKELELPVKPMFKVGDWLYHNKKGVYPILITDYDENLGYQTECLSAKTYLRQEFVEKEYHLWSIEDAKDGDVLAADECYVIFKEVDGLNIKCYCTYHYIGFNPIFYIDTLQNKTAFRPATQEQREWFFKKMKEAGYQWDSEKKELEKIKSHYNIENFHAGMPVLVRADDNCKWDYSVFSRITGNVDWNFAVCNGVSVTQCIPFEGNEHLLGTTDMCDEQYVNW